MPTPDPDRPASPTPESDSALNINIDPYRQERETFIQHWITDNPNLSQEAKSFLTQLVITEHGPWNDVENVVDVFESRIENSPGNSATVNLIYLEQGEELEIPFQFNK